MASPVVLGTGVAGLVCLALGGIVARKEVAAAHGLDKLTALACVFFAAPLAAFGAEHLTDASDIAQLIPAWVPAHLFWAYFVGVALIAAGLSLSLKRYLRLTGALTALMFFLFVAMMHIPGVVANPRDRISWAIAFRDLSFGSGALALAGAMSPRSSPGRDNAAIAVARIFLGVAMIVFGVEHFLHPGFVPVVPLDKMIPAWVPLPHLWAYLTGTVLLIAGVAILINRRTRDAAVLAGLEIVLVTLFLYVPILAMARGDKEILVGVNYVFDTLLFGGAVLLLAMATSPSWRLGRLTTA
ncbi:MAG: DoxX family membrane protein [Candidatus Korobacteraceae bacterium]